MMRGKALLSSLLIATVLFFPVLCGAEELPPAATVEEAIDRLRFLAEQAGRVDAWVEKHWEEEFGARYPSLSRAPKGPKETEQSYRNRDMRARMAISELKTGLRGERRDWLERERRALLAQEIRESLPVRLGPYDAERGEYPLLLGFGWPAGVSIRYRVRESGMNAFAQRFPNAFPGTFRVNEKGEVSLLSLKKADAEGETVVSFLPPAPRLLWQGSHDSWVTAVAFRPDGTQILSAGSEGALIAWDAGTGHRIFHLEDVEMALSVAYSPDGAALATGGTDSFLRVRDGDTGKEIWRAAAAGMIFSVAYSPDGRYIVSGDDGGGLRIWNAQSGKEILRVDLGSSVRSVAFTPGGRTVAAGGEGNFVVLWDMATGRQVWRKELGWTVLSISVGGAAGGLVAVGGGGDRILLLREADGSESWNAKADGEVRALRFDPGGRLVGSGGAGYTVRVFLAENGKLLWTASVGSPVRSLAFGSAGIKLAVGSSDFAVRLFEVDEGDRVTAAFWKYGRLYIDRARVPGLFK
jgi:outer membrane protein assembly factor BamB